MARDKDKRARRVAFRLLKKTDLAGKKTAKATKSEPVDRFALIDNGDSSVQVMGQSAAGNPVDISGVATLTPVPASSDPKTLVVDPPTGMMFMMHAMGPLTEPGKPVVVSITATWNDGSQGPYFMEMPVHIVLGIIVDPDGATVV